MLLHPTVGVRPVALQCTGLHQPSFSATGKCQGIKLWVQATAAKSISKSTANNFAKFLQKYRYRYCGKEVSVSISAIIFASVVNKPDKWTYSDPMVGNNIVTYDDVTANTYSCVCTKHHRATCNQSTNKDSVLRVGISLRGLLFA